VSEQQVICPNCRHIWHADFVRRELAEKILLKLIEVSPAATLTSGKDGEGIRLAWDIADAFLKAE
jgi:hypothetical protein